MKASHGIGWILVRWASRARSVFRMETGAHGQSLKHTEGMHASAPPAFEHRNRIWNALFQCCRHGKGRDTTRLTRCHADDDAPRPLSRNPSIFADAFGEQIPMELSTIDRVVGMAIGIDRIDRCTRPDIVGNGFPGDRSHSGRPGFDRAGAFDAAR